MIAGARSSVPLLLAAAVGCGVLGCCAASCAGPEPWSDCGPCRCGVSLVVAAAKPGGEYGTGGSLYAPQVVRRPPMDDGGDAYGIVWTDFWWPTPFDKTHRLGHALFDSTSGTIEHVEGTAIDDRELVEQLAWGAGGLVALGYFGGRPSAMFRFDDSVERLVDTVVVSEEARWNADIAASGSGYAYARTAADWIGYVSVLDQDLSATGNDMPVTPPDQPAVLRVAGTTNPPGHVLANSGWDSGLRLHWIDPKGDPLQPVVELDVGPNPTLTALTVIAGGGAFLVAWTEQPAINAPPDVYGLALIEGASVRWQTRWGVDGYPVRAGSGLKRLHDTGVFLVFWGEIAAGVERLFAAELDLDTGELGERFEPFPGTVLRGIPDVEGPPDGREYVVAFGHAEPTVMPRWGDLRSGGEVRLGHIRCDVR